MIDCSHTSRSPNTVYLQLDTLDNLRDTALLSVVSSTCCRNSSFVHGLLRRYFLLRLFEPLSLFDAGVPGGFGAVGCEAFVFENGVGEGTGTFCCCSVVFELRSAWKSNPLVLRCVERGCERREEIPDSGLNSFVCLFLLFFLLL